MIILTQDEKGTLQDVSSKLGVPYTTLYQLIKFESKFNPKIKNPRSSARGLIQFIDRTARNLGYANSADLVRVHPTIKSQLSGPVYNYLKQFKPFKTDQSLFMSVFYPRARNWPPKKLFPYDPVRRDNPGINTPEDYVNYVYGRKKLTKINPLLILIGVSTILYITFKSKKRGLYGKSKKVKIGG